MIKNDVITNRDVDCDCNEGCFGCGKCYEDVCDESDIKSCIHPDCPAAYQNAMAQGVAEDDFYGCSNIY